MCAKFEQNRTKMDKCGKLTLTRRLKRDTWTKTGAIFVKQLNGEIKKIVSDELLQKLCDNL
jgi:hypothetical protein